jgi:hypothetical protein
MRRRRFNRVALGMAFATALLAPCVSAAQGASDDGALFLLLPVGARSVGMGQATVADRGGSEAVWWNPAGLGMLTEFEAAIHHSQSIIATGDAVTIIAPIPVVGVLALSANLLNFGEQEVQVDGSGAIGILLPRSVVYAATYATGVGTRLSAGVTYKVIQLRLDCSGSCASVQTFAASTSAVDIGMQYEAGPMIPLTFGIAVRNMGLRLQVRDREQADPLPTRIQVGVRYRVQNLEVSMPDTEVHLVGDLIDELRMAQPAARFGAEVGYRQRYFFRSGYTFDEGGGPAIGAGVVAGSLVIDIGRIVGGFSADFGEPPTFVSLRYLF